MQMRYIPYCVFLLIAIALVAGCVTQNTTVPPSTDSKQDELVDVNTDTSLPVDTEGIGEVDNTTFNLPTTTLLSADPVTVYGKQASYTLKLLGVSATNAATIQVGTTTETVAVNATSENFGNLIVVVTEGGTVTEGNQSLIYAIVDVREK